MNSIGLNALLKNTVSALILIAGLSIVNTACFIEPVDRPASAKSPAGNTDIRSIPGARITFNQNLMVGDWKSECRTNIYENNNLSIVETLYLSINSAYKTTEYYLDAKCTTKLYSITYNAALSYTNNITTFAISSNVITVKAIAPQSLSILNRSGFCDPMNWVVGLSETRRPDHCGVDATQEYHVSSFAYANQVAIALVFCKNDPNCPEILFTKQ